MKINLGLPAKAKLPYEQWAIYDIDKKELIRAESLSDDRIRTYTGGLRAVDEGNNPLTLEPVTDKTFRVLREGLEVARLDLPIEISSLVLDAVPSASPGAIGNDPLTDSVQLLFCLRLSKHMTQKQTKEYRYGGQVFEYYTLTETGTNLWAADGHLKSDPNVTIRTEKFKTEREATLAFMDKAKEIAGSRTR
jgi:hypothetical protein